VHQRYLDDDRDLCRFLGNRPRSAADLLRIAPTGADRLVPRRALCEAFTAYASRHGAPDRVLENARDLEDPNVHVVITGQQPGLLGGPLFCLYKIATAIRTCRAIESEPGGVRAVPVYWNHTDDHDLEEANRLFLVNSAQEVQRFRLDLGRDGAPLRAIRCGREVQMLIDEIDQLVPQSDHRQSTLELFRPRHPDETLGDSMARLVFELFGEHGVLVIEPRDLPADAFTPLQRWWKQADEIRELVRQTSDEVSAMGIDLTMDPGATMMFEVNGDRRQPLADGENFRSVGDLSPGALIRPLWQDACLPTIAFVVGPGELSYLSIVAPLYRALGVPQPVFVPRSSLTLVEPSIQRLLGKFGWDLPYLELPPERLAKRLQGDDAGGIEGEVDQLATRVRTTLEQLGKRVVSLDASLLAAIDRTVGKTTDERSRLAQKLRSVRQNREGTGTRQIRRISANLRPRSRLQERVLGPLTFLVAHGLELGSAIIEAAEPFTVEHGILEL